jgi:indoleamine 2,3-dioxygenase
LLKNCRLATYLTDMRLHMPLSHRAFLSQLEAGPCVREAVLELSGRSSSRTPGSLAPRSQPAAATALAEAYDDAVRELEAFRGQHRGFAAKFIAQWSSKDKGGSEGTGTGGSDFMPALSAYKQTTAAHRLGV